VTAYPFVSGLLGNDLLRRFNLIVNYPERCIHLQPNSHYKEDFDYGYTGMSLYFVEEDIVVDDVIPGSPADKAGLIPGDRLVGVGNNFSGNLMQYKTQLQNTGKQIPLVISRKGQLQQCKISPINIRRH
jgi:predicted metalloprotease with PDZ domain